MIPNNLFQSDLWFQANNGRRYDSGFQCHEIVYSNHDAASNSAGMMFEIACCETVITITLFRTSSMKLC